MHLKILSSTAVLGFFLGVETSVAFLPTTSLSRPNDFFSKLITTELRITPVEQVDFETGEVINVFDSQTEAARSVEGVENSENISAVINGKSKSAGGFFWRRKGEKKLPTPRLLNPNSIPVEQIDMETGKVINVYRSAGHAARAVGGRSGSILRSLGGVEDRVSYKGYNWRKVGDVTPPRVAKSGRVCHLRQPLQQICPDTGEVIATFNSAAEAGFALGIKAHTISKVLRGLYHTTGGYHFKKVGEPETFKRNSQGRPVHQVCVETGEIIETFRSGYAAGRAVGVAGSSISSAVRGKTNTSAGYRWVYADEQQEEELQ